MAAYWNIFGIYKNSDVRAQLLSYQLHLKNLYEWGKHVKILGLFWVLGFHMGDF